MTPQLETILVDHHGVSVASWHGPPPQVGDTVRVVVEGDEAAEPRDGIWRVTGMHWFSRTVCTDLHVHVSAVCHVAVKRIGGE